MKKLIKKSFHQKESGFTLIELLIVIVIIGILAGVLIAVINPVRQQNRARNAAVRAAMLKAAFAINTTRAGIGRLPSGTELTIELENMTPISTSCANAADLDCFFDVSGTVLPSYCDGTDMATPTDATTGQCHMHLINTSANNDLTDGTFRIAAPAYKIDPAGTAYEIYLFDSSRGLLVCNGNFDYDTSAPLGTDDVGTRPTNPCEVQAE